jgi:hypothetical protein
MHREEKRRRDKSRSKRPIVSMSLDPMPDTQKR